MSNINYFAKLIQNLNFLLFFLNFINFKKVSNINVFLSKKLTFICKFSKDFLIVVYNF